MEWLAEFVGYYGPLIQEGQPECKAWGFWMTEVEPRIREKGLYDEYMISLWENLCGPYEAVKSMSQGSAASYLMQSTLAQRAEALRRVLCE